MKYPRECPNLSHFWSEWLLWKAYGQSFLVSECLWCKKEERRDIETPLKPTGNCKIKPEGL